MLGSFLSPTYRAIAAAKKMSDNASLIQITVPSYGLSSWLTPWFSLGLSSWLTPWFDPLVLWFCSHRMSVVEPVFGNVTSNKGLKRFSLRSKIKVNAQWKLFCLIQNIEKLANYGKITA